MGNACLPMPRILRRSDLEPCTIPPRNAVVAIGNDVSGSSDDEGRSNVDHPWLIFGLLSSARTRQLSEEQMVLEALRVIRTLVDK